MKIIPKTISVREEDLKHPKILVASDTGGDVFEMYVVPFPHEDGKVDLLNLAEYVFRCEPKLTNIIYCVLNADKNGFFYKVEKSADGLLECKKYSTR